MMNSDVVGCCYECILLDVVDGLNEGCLYECRERKRKLDTIVTLAQTLRLPWNAVVHARTFSSVDIRTLSCTYVQLSSGDDQPVAVQESRSQFDLLSARR